VSSNFLWKSLAFVTPTGETGVIERGIQGQGHKELVTCTYTGPASGNQYTATGFFTLAPDSGRTTTWIALDPESRTWACGGSHWSGLPTPPCHRRPRRGFRSDSSARRSSALFVFARAWVGKPTRRQTAPRPA
jgi:hypothetical protein